MFPKALLADERIPVVGGETGIGRTMAQRTKALGARSVICGGRTDKDWNDLRQRKG